jgi:hypothetical protein
LISALISDSIHDQPQLFSASTHPIHPAMPPPTPRSLVGVVVSAGKMMKAVKVRVPKQEWNSYVRKVWQTLALRCRDR